jgi:hypothetical protein
LIISSIWQHYRFELHIARPASYIFSKLLLTKESLYGRIINVKYTTVEFFREIRRRVRLLTMARNPFQFNEEENRAKNDLQSSGRIVLKPAGVGAYKVISPDGFEFSFDIVMDHVKIVAPVETTPVATSSASPFGNTVQPSSPQSVSPFGGQAAVPVSTPTPAPVQAQPTASPFGGQSTASPFGGQATSSPFGNAYATTDNDENENPFHF